MGRWRCVAVAKTGVPSPREVVRAGVRQYTVPAAAGGLKLPGIGVFRYGNAALEVGSRLRTPSVKGSAAGRRVARACSRPCSVSLGAGQHAQRAHRDAQSTVDHVVARPAAVREAGVVAAGHAEAFCAPRGSARSRCSGAASRTGTTLAGWFRPAMPVRNAVDQVGAREVGRRLGRHGEQRLEQRRQGRIGHVVGELRVVLRLARR